MSATAFILNSLSLHANTPRDDFCHDEIHSCLNTGRDCLISLFCFFFFLGSPLFERVKRFSRVLKGLVGFTRLSDGLRGLCDDFRNF